MKKKMETGRRKLTLLEIVIQSKCSNIHVNKFIEIFILCSKIIYIVFSSPNMVIIFFA